MLEMPTSAHEPVITPKRRLKAKPFTPLAPAKMADDLDDALESARANIRVLLETTDLGERVARAWEHEDALARGESPMPSGSPSLSR